VDKAAARYFGHGVLAANKRFAPLPLCMKLALGDALNKKPPMASLLRKRVKF
jgi:hypothetical protein